MAIIKVAQSKEEVLKYVAEEQLQQQQRLVQEQFGLPHALANGLFKPGLPWRDILSACLVGVLGVCIYMAVVIMLPSKSIAPPAQIDDIATFFKIYDETKAIVENEPIAIDYVHIFREAIALPSIPGDVAKVEEIRRTMMAMFKRLDETLEQKSTLQSQLERELLDVRENSNRETNAIKAVKASQIANDAVINEVKLLNNTWMKLLVDHDLLRNGIAEANEAHNLVASELIQLMVDERRQYDLLDKEESKLRELNDIVSREFHESTVLQTENENYKASIFRAPNKLLEATNKLKELLTEKEKLTESIDASRSQLSYLQVQLVRCEYINTKLERHFSNLFASPEYASGAPISLRSQIEKEVKVMEALESEISSLSDKLDTGIGFTEAGVHWGTLEMEKADAQRRVVAYKLIVGQTGIDEVNNWDTISAALAAFEEAIQGKFEALRKEMSVLESSRNRVNNEIDQCNVEIAEFQELKDNGPRRQCELNDRRLEMDARLNKSMDAVLELNSTVSLHRIALDDLEKQCQAKKQREEQLKIELERMTTEAERCVAEIKRLQLRENNTLDSHHYEFGRFLDLRNELVNVKENSRRHRELVDELTSQIRKYDADAQEQTRLILATFIPKEQSCDSD